MAEKIVYLNGEYLERNRAQISIFDRGFLFGDGVYEVVPVLKGRVLDLEPFFERFHRSLAGLKLPDPLGRERTLELLGEMIARNALEEGGIYLQVTRGAEAVRRFEFPEALRPTVMAFAFAKSIRQNRYALEGVSVATVEDLRWKRRQIKSIALLAQCLAKEAAREQGAYEGWMIEEGFVTEGTASSAYIVKNGRIVTRPLGGEILPGIRRKILLELAPAHGIEVEQRPFTPQEAYEADEAFLSSATTLIYPVVSIDGHSVGDGRPGPITRRLRELYLEAALAEAKKI